MTESSHSGWHPCLAAQRATSTSTNPRIGQGWLLRWRPLLGWAPRENLVARDVSIAELSPSTRPRHLDSSSSSLVCRLGARYHNHFWHAREHTNNLYGQQQTNRGSGSHTAWLATVPSLPAETQRRSRCSTLFYSIRIRIHGKPTNKSGQGVYIRKRP